MALPQQLREKKDDLVVEYVVIKEKAHLELPAKTMSIKSIETAKVELKKNVDVKQVVPENKAQPRKDIAIKQKKADAISRKEARVRKTRDYIGYYQLIREKIRQRLKYNYSGYRKEGDVRLVFTLRRDGSLINTKAGEELSRQDPTLREIAVSSLREASPFPAFPKALALLEMSFDVVISFKKE
jgi:outer membrane biosynthesis protein TonB